MNPSNRTQSYAGKLDRERAQSMADEGGVSGAIVDAREQGADFETDSLLERRRWGAAKVWALAGLGVAACVLIAGLTRH